MEDAPSLAHFSCLRLFHARCKPSFGKAYACPWGKLARYDPHSPSLFGGCADCTRGGGAAFPGLLIRLFRPFGDASAILLSALLFALAHGSLFQMPYAFVAGLFLAFAATASGGILYPLLFHVFYNLLTFFGGKIPTLPLLWSLGGLAAFSLLLFLLGKHPKLTKGDVRPSVRELLPLLCYAVLMAIFALLNF
ncbi:MAG: CPBP family intramembrane metalloprotease [Ruminococcaceae bacterium]|nr:CPBP family intramembrane metalloprotease [Oscillospiraceae bacterium]